MRTRKDWLLRGPIASTRPPMRAACRSARSRREKVAVSTNSRPGCGQPRVTCSGRRPGGGAAAVGGVAETSPAPGSAGACRTRAACAAPGGGARSSRCTAPTGAAATWMGAASGFGRRAASARDASPFTAIRTWAAPPGRSPINSAARRERPMTRLGFSGPRSFTRTSISSPVSRFVTRRIAGNCRVRCAAIRAPPS